MCLKSFYITDLVVYVLKCSDILVSPGRHEEITIKTEVGEKEIVRGGKRIVDT